MRPARPSFAPIAIVGQACVLPGALSPAELWQAVVSGRDLLGRVPPERWRRPADQALRSADDSDADRSWSDRGGYVQGFEAVWDPSGFATPPDQLAHLDPLVHWVLHCAREALRDAEMGCGAREALRDAGAIDTASVGAVFGNLGFPSEAMAEYAARVWRGEPGGDPRNRLMSSGTASALRDALQLGRGSYCIDAACASSLYAMKLACDSLQAGRADAMLAGAVQRADDLFLHVGFCALNALSRSGRSRPFHRDADGLVPAEGAAFFVLKRLEDARRDGDRIHAVIRGIGLSNDGRGKGFLAPDEDGQGRAMQAAFDCAGMRPEQVSLLECHATGTPVGDATELRSSASVYAECRELPIGSLKSNLGHLITTAGAAGVIKLIEAMRHQRRPPTLHVEHPHAALTETPFRLLQAEEAWPSEGPRVAAVSAFGFGGNNAHLLLSEEDPGIPLVEVSRAHVPLAIVGIGARVASLASREALTTDWLEGGSALNAAGEGRMEVLSIDLQGIRFPPRDIQQTLPQQLALLEASREAVQEAGPLSRTRTAILIGMEPDAEVCRYGLRWRLDVPDVDATRLRQVRDAIVPVLESAAVVGCMPNIPANRLSSQFDLAGPAFTLQAGSGSGLRALQVAADALGGGEIDAAIVGAVDLACEPVQRSVMAMPAGDAAVALVIKRLYDAQRSGDRIYAAIDAQGTMLEFAHADERTDVCIVGADVAKRYGTAPAAQSLLEVTLGALSLHHRRLPDGRPWLSAARRRIQVGTQVDAEISALASADIASCLTLIDEPDALRRAERPGPRLYCFAGADRANVIEALRAGHEGRDGSARLVLVSDAEGFDVLRRRALAHLQDGAPVGPNIQFRDKPIDGGIGFAFAGAGAAYPGMGRALVQALPELLDRLAARSAQLATALDWCYRDDGSAPSASAQLRAASALSQVHVELSRGLLGLQADAWLGYSSGETNALFGSGVWNDPDALIADMDASGLMEHELGGDFAAVARAWGEPASWACWAVLAPLDEVRAALTEASRVHLAIINGEQDCMIAGDAAQCDAVIECVGRGRCLRLDYTLAAHVPEVEQVAAAWRTLHSRPSSAPVSGRIYSNAFGSAYEPTRERCAEALLQQAVRTLDVRPAILQAWQDGIRVFVEHGPGGTYARAIREALGTRDALVVSLDRKGQGIDGLLCAAAALLAAGVPIDVDAFAERLQPSSPFACQQEKRVLRLPVHPHAPQFPDTTAEQPAHQIMLPAPRLPPVLSTRSPLPTTPPVASKRAANDPLDPSRSALPALPQAGTRSTRAWLSQVSAVHARFLQDSAQAHQHFLRIRQAALGSLAGGLTTAPASRTRAEGTEGLHHAAGCAPVHQSNVHRATLPRHPGDPRTAAAVPTPQPVPPPLEIAPVIPAAATASALLLVRAGLPGPRFSRAQLEIHAGGRIADIFGPAFAHQDAYARQVRMPQPPLLLADRVVGLEGEPGAMGKGRIWTQTDVGSQDWYLHHGHMPAGVMIEAGQADLMLISWLGVDAHNRGRRVYRLLGCELTYHGDLPQRGERIDFEITLDGHAAQGDVRLMFFHYDCMNGDRLQLSVREGQAGFFTAEELAESAGCLWRPEDQVLRSDAQLDAPSQLTQHTAFDRAALQAFAAGDVADCFGSGFEFARTHTRSPSIHGGRMLLQDRVTRFDVRGGPWQRGYLCAELDIDPGLWFFDGHFKNDPCMPGTLMFEGCLQMLAFYLAGCGFTLPRDGWRFQPVPDIPYKLQCRGQVIPSSKLLVTEIFVEELIAGPVPTVYADLLCTVDGLKAFHARRVGLQLVPDWPLDEALLAAPLEQDDRPCAEVDGFRFDQRALLACALGRPSEAFGPMYRRFDAPGRVPRLPSPPYHFISRIAEITGAIGVMKVGARVVAEYDIPESVWYFDENGSRQMPFAVLLEVALQPCGWLASYVGSALTVDSELGFRNLDGEGEVLAELTPGCGALRTEVVLTDVSATGGMIIQGFRVECRLGTRLVYRLRTVFGFFPPSALAAQAGLPKLDAQFELLRRPSNLDVDLAQGVGGALPRLPGSMLRMIDRIEGHWPQAGVAGLGQLRAVKFVDSDEWFFKAHFFQDPVQPGSLGLEAMLQLLQYDLLQADPGAGMLCPRFESIGLGRHHSWKYRGQVLPHHRQVHTTMEITERGIDARGRYALANASLWADGQRIYEAIGLCVRLVETADLAADHHG